MPQSRSQASTTPCHPGRSSVEGRRAGCRRRAAFLLLTALLLMLSPAAGIQPAGAQEPLALAEYRSGVVTDNSGTVLYIDDRAYRLDPGVTVTDEEGRVQAIQGLKRGDVIKFHLRNGKVDQIIWILPR